ncbi:transposase [Candidatus Parcubacteria bacterium]|nr:transposase [Candidatus Parcubacteria bacterium]
MPIQRPQLVNGEIYHIVIRGVGDSLIFKDENDYYRAIFSLYEFNTIETPITIRERRKVRIKIKKRNKEQFSDNRDLLVEIWAFYFMPNHIHLLVKQLKDEGISQFMRKFGAGYAAYFNKKYNRKGHLFQGRFRAVHIKTNEQLKTVFVYIHTNGISLIEPKWKEIGIKNPEKVIEFLENYKWSSYPDYIGKKNFHSVTERDFMLEVMGGKEGCRKFIENWVKYKKEIK